MLNKPLQTLPVGGCSFWSLGELAWAACELGSTCGTWATLASPHRCIWWNLTWASLIWLGAVISGTHGSASSSPSSHDPDS